MASRFDDDDEDNGNHGNTKIPFGLCQREGITVQPGWTPKDAWNALEGKGYSASETYKKLKETGSTKGTSSGASSKSSGRSIKRERIPDTFKSGVGKKILDSFETEFSKMDADEPVKELLSDFGRIAMDGASYQDGLKVEESDDVFDYSTGYRPMLGEGKVTEQSIRIPDLSKLPEESRRAHASSIAHEIVHFLNSCHRPADDDYFEKPCHTASNKELDDELQRVTYEDIFDFSGKKRDGEYGFSDEVTEVLKKNFSEFNKLKTSYLEETRRNHDKIVSEYNQMAIDMGVGKGQFAYCSLPPELKKEMNDKVDGYEARREKEFGKNYLEFGGDGASSFSNMYEALARGANFAQELCYAGHGWQYYEGQPWRVGDEVLSIYVQLQLAEDKSYLNLFKKDQPRLAKLLDEEIAQLVGHKR